MCFLVTAAKERNFRHFTKLVQEKSRDERMATATFGTGQWRIKYGTSVGEARRGLYLCCVIENHLIV